MDFVCPKCGGALASFGNSKKCALGHSFDRAKEGYYNLLLGAGRGTHGDNAEMVKARREFLALGHYEPLARCVAELVLSYTGKGECVLDCGSGEGYYTDIIESALYSRDGESRVYGFDISKDAVRLAAKKNKRLTLAVASAYSMPVGDGTVDTALNIFSPLAKDELLRVIRHGGRFIMVYPAENHLFELKKRIYDNPYKNTPECDELSGFKLLLHKRLSYDMSLCSEDEVRSLFMMTPYAYRTPREARERVLSLDGVRCEADFYINVYERNQV